MISLVEISEDIRISLENIVSQVCTCTHLLHALLDAQCQKCVVTQEQTLERGKVRDRSHTVYAA